MIAGHSEYGLARIALQHQHKRGLCQTTWNLLPCCAWALSAQILRSSTVDGGLRVQIFALEGKNSLEVYAGTFMTPLVRFSAQSSFDR